MNTTRTEAEVYDAMRDIERRHGLFRLVIDGVSPWQLVKFEASVFAQGVNLARKPIGRSVLMFSVFRGVGKIFRRRRKVRYLCKSFDSAYRIPAGRHFQDIYFDVMIDAIKGGAKMSSCDAAGFEVNRNAALRPPELDDTFVIILSALFGRFFPRHKHHSVFEAIERIMAQEGVRISAQRVSRVYNAFHWRSVIYQQILRKMRPSVVLCADGGQFALMAAAKTLSIPYIEMQHGLTTKSHPNVLPGDIADDERQNLMMPDFFAVYGQHVVDALQGSLLEKEGRVAPVGSGVMDVARRSSARAYEGQTRPFVVTFTAQGIATRQVANVLADFLKKIDKPVLLQIKLHPAYDSDKAELTLAFQHDPRVLIFDGQQSVSTNDLIAASNLHASISSSCHYDALGLGTPTVVLALETHESVSDLMGTPGVYLAHSGEELVSIVSGEIKRVPEETSNHHFAYGFVDRMASLLDRATGVA